ncbi:MAG TPA: glycosyltransferase family 1 protein [Gemmatimonadaceae bacterium]|nr:glycosyltransferase family 1 protein [Gemmatimonadaceae bacterium]
MKETRVGFTLIGGAGWTGGRAYLTNLLRAVASDSETPLSSVVFVGDNVSDEEVGPLGAIRNVEVVRSGAFTADRTTRQLLTTFVRGTNAPAVREFLRHDVNVVFENASFYGRNCPIPAIAWLPDFQHHRLRSLFSRRSFWRRELGFRAQLAGGRTIMLSSEDSRSDCERYYPSSIGRTFVVHFAAFIEQMALEADPWKRVREYDLPAKFLYLPNQFWTHKNHRAVIEALGILKYRGRDIVVAASGNPVDDRNPEHFSALQRRIEELDVANNFRVLGLIPRAHLVSLLRSCTALINPSFFEGWSTTVEEARALGVPMILSDIGTHREQMGERAIYFDPGNAADVADKLEYYFVTATPPSQARAPRDQNRDEVARFAREFARVVARARETFRQ